MRTPRLLAWLTIGLVTVAIGAWRGRKAHAPGSVTVASTDAGPTFVAMPDAGHTMPDAAPVVVAVAVPDASVPRVAPPPHVAGPSKPQRGVAYAGLITKWVPAEAVPRALAIIADVCEQDRLLTDDSTAHFRDDLDHGKKFDSEAGLSVARAIRDSHRDALRLLAALPGSTFDKAAWLELTATPSYKNDCLHEGDKPYDDE